VAHGAADIVPIVELDAIPAAGRIAAFVKSAAVVRLGADMVDFVELEHMIIAAHENRLVGRVMDQVVGGTVADAFEGEAVGRGELVFGKAPDVIVAGLVPGGRQRLSIAAPEHQAALASMMNVAR